MDRRAKTVGTWLMVAGLFGASGTARAQETPPYDQAIEVQLFQPAVGRQPFLTVSGAEIMPARQFQLGLSVTYMTGALTVYNVRMDDTLEPTPRTEVVKSVFGGHLGGAYGLRDDLQLGATLPLVFAMSGDGLDPSTAMPAAQPLSVTGLGDVSVELAWRFWAREGLSLSAIPTVTVPTSVGSGDGAFLGDDLPSFRPRAALEWSTPDGLFSLGANVGVILRKPRTLYSSEVGQQLTYGIAGAYHVSETFDLVGELFGRNGFGDDLDESPLEADGALRIGVAKGITVVVGGGAGVVRGLGSPGLRVFAAVNWSPDYRDSDGDGVPNIRDKCPFFAEDRDGHLDHDGCPEADNDGDKLSDLEDKCPNEAEDKDGFEDEDGCPELDNDRDGIADLDDRCPERAEDKLPPYANDGCPASMRDSDDDGVVDANDQCPNDFEDLDGFADDDGCPEPDNDLDGLLDEADRCPAVAEDKDGFEDDDGCPELDNDHDGFADADDKCPNERETVNGVADWDGCPDTGGRTLARLDGNKIALDERLLFDGGAVKKRSFELLDQVALTMRGAPEVVKWRVVVAAEKQRSEDATRALSQQRADAVRAYLVSKGVPADRIDAVGVVSDRPVVVFAAVERAGAPTPDEGETVPEEAPEQPAEGGIELLP